MRWTSQFGDDALGPAGQTWAKGLANLAPMQIAQGFDSVVAAAMTWPPTLPEFKALCIGIPSIATVRADLAQRNSQRMPFTRLVWSKVDAYRYRISDAEESDSLIESAYRVARDAVMRGAPLPPALPEIAAEKQQRNPATAETAMREIERCRNLFKRLDGDEGEAATC